MIMVRYQPRLKLLVSPSTDQFQERGVPEKKLAVFTSKSGILF